MCLDILGVGERIARIGWTSYKTFQTSNKNEMFSIKKLPKPLC